MVFKASCDRQIETRYFGTSDVVQGLWCGATALPGLRSLPKPTPAFVAPCNAAVRNDRPPESRVARREGDHSWSPKDDTSQTALIFRNDYSGGRLPTGRNSHDYRLLAEAEKTWAVHYSSPTPSIPSQHPPKIPFPPLAPHRPRAVCSSHATNYFFHAQSEPCIPTR